MFLKELHNDSKNMIGVQQGCKVGYWFLADFEYFL